MGLVRVLRDFLNVSGAEGAARTGERDDARTRDRPGPVPSSDEDASLIADLFPVESPARTHRGGLSRRGWAILVGIVGAAVIVLLILSAVAIRNPVGFARVGVASASSTASPPSPPVDPFLPNDPAPSPTASEVPTAPIQPVSTLTTGDCLQTYPSPWESGYPVVDCSAPHIAQVLSTGSLPQPLDAPFPGTTALTDQVDDLCSAPDLLNWNWVAVWNEDVFVDARYPNTNALWASGARTYYCFVYTASRHELTGSAVAAP